MLRREHRGEREGRGVVHNTWASISVDDTASLVTSFSDGINFFDMLSPLHLQKRSVSTFRTSNPSDSGGERRPGRHQRVRPGLRHEAAEKGGGCRKIGCTLDSQPHAQGPGGGHGRGDFRGRPAERLQPAEEGGATRWRWLCERCAQVCLSVDRCACCSPSIVRSGTSDDHPGVGTLEGAEGYPREYQAGKVPCPLA